MPIKSGRQRWLVQRKDRKRTTKKERRNRNFGDVNFSREASFCCINYSVDAHFLPGSIASLKATKRCGQVPDLQQNKNGWITTRKSARKHFRSKIRYIQTLCCPKCSCSFEKVKFNQPHGEEQFNRGQNRSQIGILI
jgi:hypothetical protein